MCSYAVLCLEPFQLQQQQQETASLTQANAALHRKGLAIGEVVGAALHQAVAPYSPTTVAFTSGAWLGHEKPGRCDSAKAICTLSDVRFYESGVHTPLGCGFVR